MPQKSEVIIGYKSNKLTVLEDLGTRRVGKCGMATYVMAECECGNKIEILYNDIKQGHTISCGCYSRKVCSERMTTHGLSNTRIYRIWKDMRRRCNNPNRKNYDNYGGRGIKVCEEWNDFINFYNWGMTNGYEDNLSIDRIDVDGNYEPLNCRWATSITQNSNTRKNRKFQAISPSNIVFYHESQSEFARIHDLNRKYINSCLIGKQKSYKGWQFKYVG